MTVLVQRNGEQRTITVQAARDGVSERWLIGISPPVNVQRYGPVDAVVLGAERIGQMTAGTFAFLGQLVTGNGSLDSLGGPVRIGAVLGDAARTSFTSLLFLMAFISLQLGILNLLPIPALDGGHIVMVAVELLRGHPLSARLRERAQFIGFSLLMLLILFVTYNDILQLMT
jgi:regulator of sigma E protease